MPTTNTPLSAARLNHMEDGIYDANESSVGMVDTLKQNIGLDNDTWDENATYNINNLVIRNNTIYKCSQDNTTGTWNPNKWEQLSIIDSNVMINKNLIKELIKREVATAKLTSKVNANQGNIYFNSLTSTTDRLTLSNGCIKIGADVKKILVSGNAFLENADAGRYFYTLITINGSLVSSSICDTIRTFGSTAHTPILIDVNENDIIALNLPESYPGMIRNIGNTYLTVEVIE